jgi:hypothetical protein
MTCKWRVFSTGPSYGERHWIARKPHTVGWDGIAEFRTHGDAFRFADAVARYVAEWHPEQQIDCNCQEATR